MAPSRKLDIPRRIRDQFRDYVLAERYQFQEPIGMGSYAYVFRAYDIKNTEYVAVKVSIEPGDPPRSFLEASTDRPVDRLYVEAVYNQRLERGVYGIAQYKDHHYDPQNQHMFLVLRFLGRSFLTVSDHINDQQDAEAQGPAAADELASRWRSLPATASGGLAVEISLRIAIRVAGCLAVAHRRGIVHRDCHVKNIMIEPGRTEMMELPANPTPLDLVMLPLKVFVIDWGCAKDYESKEFTDDLKPIGTLLSRTCGPHLPREASEGIHWSHDVYSVALDLIQMIAGSTQIYREHDEIEEVIQSLPLSEYLKNLLTKVLIQEYRRFGPNGAFKRQDRTTMQEFQERLRQGLHDLVISYYLDQARQEQEGVIQKAASLEQQLDTLLVEKHRNEKEARLRKERLEEALESAKTERDQIRSELSLALEAGKQAERQIELLRAKPQGTQQPIPLSHEKHQRIEQDNARLSQLVTSAREVQENLKAQLSRTDARRSRAESDLQTAEAEIQRAREALAKSDNRARFLDETLGKNSRDLQLLQAERDLLYTEGEALKERLQQVAHRLQQADRRLQQASYLRPALAVFGLALVVCSGLGVYNYTRKGAPAQPRPPVAPKEPTLAQLRPPTETLIHKKLSPPQPPVVIVPAPPERKAQATPSPKLALPAAEASPVAAALLPREPNRKDAVCRISMAADTRNRHHFKGIAVTEPGSIVLAASSEKGTATGNGLVWLSKDNGASWTAFPDSAHPGYSGLTMLGSDEAVAMGDGGVLHLRVEGQSADWLPTKRGEKPQSFSAGFGTTLEDLFIVSASPGGFGWRVVDRDKEKQTIGTWQQADGRRKWLQTGNSFFAIAGDATSMWAVGYAGQISSTSTKPAPTSPFERDWITWEHRGSQKPAIASAGDSEQLRAALRDNGESVFCGSVGDSRGVVYHAKGPVKNWDRIDLDFPCFAVASLDDKSYLLAGSKLVLEDKVTHQRTEVVETPCDFATLPIHGLWVVSAKQVYVVGNSGLFYRWER